MSRTAFHIVVCPIWLKIANIQLVCLLHISLLQLALHSLRVSDFYCLGQYGYDRIMRVLGRNLRDFLNGLDNLHEYLRFSNPHLKPPSFFCEHETKQGLILHYRYQGLNFTTNFPIHIAAKYILVSVFLNDKMYDFFVFCYDLFEPTILILFLTMLTIM